jgi:hypothetical protein
VKRAFAAVLAAALAALLLQTVTAGSAYATPPNIPSASTAASRLAELTVAAESHQSTYDRSLFPHWIIISGTCDTREEVLMRDGTNVVTDSSCAATSGTWVSPYDGATWHAASDVDIDHMVPLAEAWRSGVDHVAAPDLRQRPRRAGAVGRHRQREPGKGRPGPDHVEAAADVVLVHVREGLDPGQVVLPPQRAERREDRADLHAGPLLRPLSCA